MPDNGRQLCFSFCVFFFVVAKHRTGCQPPAQPLSQVQQLWPQVSRWKPGPDQSKARPDGVADVDKWAGTFCYLFNTFKKHCTLLLINISCCPLMHAAVACFQEPPNIPAEPEPGICFIIIAIHQSATLLLLFFGFFNTSFRFLYILFCCLFCCEFSITLVILYY